MCWHLRIKQLCERKGFFADQFDLRTKWSVFEYQSSNLIISSVIWDKWARASFSKANKIVQA